MECGVVPSLMIARWGMGRERGGIRLGGLLLDTLRCRGILLLTGGMLIGHVSRDSDWQRISPFYEQLFQGFLMLFLLELGITTARENDREEQVGRLHDGLCCPR